MADLDYKLFDADNHYSIPKDCFSRYIEPKYKDKVIHSVTLDDGTDRVMIGDKLYTFSSGGFARKMSTRPGALWEKLRNKDAAQISTPDYFMKREPRLKVMDEQGVESIFIFPGIAACVEHFMKDDVEQLYANFHSHNLWLDEEWGFNYKDRIFAPPLLSLLDLDRAVDELDFVLAKGTRMICMRAAPAFGRSPADPYFDPFWSRVNEAKVSVAFHIAESGFNELYSTAWGEQANPSAESMSAFQWILFYGDRPIMETICSLIYYNFFGRFPNINIASVENGSVWVPYLLAAMDKMKGMGRNGPWPGGYVKGRFSEVFKQYVFVTPHHYGEDIPALVRLIGPSQVLFGSDFPHPEGMAEPKEFASRLGGLPADQVRMIMRDNAWRLVQPSS